MAPGFYSLILTQDINPTDMESSTIRRLAEIAHRAPSADNNQHWRLEWNGQFLGIFYDRARVTGKTFPPESPASLLSIGALIENIMTTAAEWKLGPELEMAANPGSAGNALYAKISFTPQAQVAPARLTHPIANRHTNREAYIATEIPENACINLRESSQGLARTWFSQNTAVRKRAARLVRKASEIRFQTQEVHEWLGKSLRFSREAVDRGDGMDIATLGLPPGGGYFLRLISDWSRMRFLNSLGMHKIVAAIDSAPIGSGPGLLAIIAPADSPGTIDAGRLLERLWFQLNDAGLAVHPYYVVADQLARLADRKIPDGLEALALEVAQGSQDLFGLSGEETLHMLFRVGYPKREAKRSLRLPLDEVFIDQTL
jgi:hypothetical protein